MSYSSLQIANAFIKKAKKTGDTDFSPMKLLKLTYIAHGFMLGMYDKPLISDNAEAWKYGPVYKDQYHATKHYRGNAVTEPIPEVAAPDFSDEAEDIISQVHKIYGKKSAIELSMLTHQQGTPWSEIYNRIGKEKRINKVIPDGLIREYYKYLVDNNQ